jgi:hypothetical protein
MVDNFEDIADMMNFHSDDDFYFIQIIQRRKENPDMEKGSRAIKNYIIRSYEQLELYRPDIIAFCNHFNARATIRLNKRSFKQCAFKTLSAMADNVSNEDYRPADKVYSQIMGKYAADPDKKWIIDIDDMEDDHPEVSKILEVISTYEPVGDKLHRIIKSKTGCHLVTRPFNLKSFKDDYPKIDVMKDGISNIYIP